jgi:hypothetical protein
MDFVRGCLDITFVVMVYMRGMMKERVNLISKNTVHFILGETTTTQGAYQGIQLQPRDVRP